MSNPDVEPYKTMHEVDASLRAFDEDVQARFAGAADRALELGPVTVSSNNDVSEAIALARTIADYRKILEDYGS